MKHEWKKHEKELYGAKKEPATVYIPSQNFIMISGKGNPNYPDFSEKVSALYSLAYAVKMDFKSGAENAPAPGGITDYAVYPLEGIWGLAEGKPFDELPPHTRSFRCELGGFCNQTRMKIYISSGFPIENVLS